MLSRTALRDAMVTYSLRRVCGGCTAILVPQTVRRPYVFLCKLYGDLKGFSSPQCHRKPCRFFQLHINLFFRDPNATTPQPHRNVTVWWPYGGLAMGVMWNTVFILSWVPRKSYGGLTVPFRRPYGKLVVAAMTLSVPPGHLPVSLRTTCGFLFQESYDRHAVAVTFVTTTIVARRTLRSLEITFYKP